MSEETAELSDQIGTLEAVATFNGADGIEHPYRELERLAANERDHQKRVTLDHAALPVVDRLTPLLEQKETVTLSLPDLGYPTYAAYAAELRDVDSSTRWRSRRTPSWRRRRASTGPAWTTRCTPSSAWPSPTRAGGHLALRRLGLDLETTFPAERMVPRLRGRFSAWASISPSDHCIRIATRRCQQTRARSA